MRCSLLILSSHLDGELEPERRGEVDAHLVGCQRCRSGLGYLEEEVTRIGALATVHVPDSSMYGLMQQLGLIGAEDRLPARTIRPDVPQRDDSPPWMFAGTSRAALPWAPLRKHAEDSEEVDDNQPALPFSDVPLHEMPSHPARSAASAASASDEAEIEISGRAIHEPPPYSFVIEPSVDDPDLETAAPAPAVEPAISSAQEIEPDPGPVMEAPRDRSTTMEAGAARGSPAAPAEPGQSGAESRGVAWGEWLPPPPPPPIIEAASIEPAATLSADDLDDDAWSWAPRDDDPVRHTQATAQVTPPMPPSPRALPPAESGADPAAPRFDPPARIDAEPERLARPSPFTRVRDQIALRMALARHNHRQVDDGVQIVSGRGAPERAYSARRPSTRPRPEPRRGAPAPIESGGPISAAVRSGPDAAVEGNPRRPLTQRFNFRRPARSPDDADLAIPSSPFPDDPLRPPGRHTRGLTFRRSPLARIRFERVPGALAAFAAAVVERGRTTLADPRRRWLGIAGVAAVFVLLMLGLFRLTSATPATSRTQPPAQQSSGGGQGAAASHSSPPTAAARSAPPAASSAPAPILPQPKTFGDGGQGWQIERIRYGIHPGGKLRIVFDLGPAGSAASGSPTALVSFPDPHTMVVTFSGVVAAGTAGALPAGVVVTSVTETQASGGQTVIRFGLAHPVGFSAEYLAASSTAPLRLVIDVG